MKKIVFFRMTTIAMMVCFTAFTAEVAAFSGTGSGVMEDPYVITTAEQLVEINVAPAAYYELGANIDLTDYIEQNWPTDGWMPLSPSGGSIFSGTLDGQGYAITGLWINRPTMVCAGLFGVVNAGTATFRNLAIKTTADGVYGFKQVGGLLGGVSSSANDGTTITIENCSFEGDVSGRRAVGAFIGYSYKGVINLQNCFAGGSVTIKHVSDGDNEKVEAVGGLIGAGWNTNTVNIINCYATNTVIAIADEGTTDTGENVGGLIGMQGTSGTVGNPPSNTAQGEKDKLKAAKIKIENSVAINPSVTSNGTANRVHRIGGWIKSLPIPGLTNSTLTNNKSLAVMEVADVNGDVSIVSDGAGADGEDVSADDLKKRSTFESDLSFDFSVAWAESGNAYPFPVLQAIRAENRPTAVPSNLTALFTTSGIVIQQAAKTNILFDASTNLLKIGEQGAKVTIFDSLGRLVIGATKSEIDLSGLSSGMYIVKVNDQSVKILK
jgi:hypothetical protein